MEQKEPRSKVRANHKFLTIKDKAGELIGIPNSKQTKLNQILGNFRRKAAKRAENQ